MANEKKTFRVKGPYPVFGVKPGGTVSVTVDENGNGSSGRYKNVNIAALLEQGVVTESKAEGAKPAPTA